MPVSYTVDNAGRLDCRGNVGKLGSGGTMYVMPVLKLYTSIANIPR